MTIALNDVQAASKAEFHEFVQQEIHPHANRWDREERMPSDVVERLGRKGYLGGLVPRTYGGAGMDMVTFGLLNEEVGRGCSSVRSLLTVHGMVQFAILRWGREDQKEKWLPRLATGEAIGAFGLTEPGSGSDAAGIQTTADVSESSYILNGTKVWTTFGQIANLVLVFAKQDGRICAFVVETDRPGFSATPVSGLLGTRAAMVANLKFDSCVIPKENRIGGVGFGFSAVGSAALDIGRYSVACGCVGIAQASLDASIEYASTRKQYGVLIKDHQLIRKLITEMVVNVRAARALCHHAGQLKDAGDPRTMMETLIAKYFASKAATQSANDAVQIHGANGCGAHYPVQRYYRDVKIMEIIEGSSQILEINIAKEACDLYGSDS
jgi:alkylation response protein AidB-like acyl-CoA dehydrogenase